MREITDKEVAILNYLQEQGAGTETLEKVLFLIQDITNSEWVRGYDEGFAASEESIDVTKMQPLPNDWR